jgi:hypothetical protein
VWCRVPGPGGAHAVALTPWEGTRAHMEREECFGGDGLGEGPKGAKTETACDGVDPCSFSLKIRKHFCPRALSEPEGGGERTARHTLDPRPPNLYSWTLTLSPGP